MIQGKVTHAATGAPIKKATVTAYPTPSRNAMTGGPITPAIAETDAEGKFILKDLEPGEYRVSANRTGFVRQNYGSKKPNQGGTPLTLKPGQKMDSIDMRMTQHSVITGKVTDEDGEPLAQVNLQLFRFNYFRGRKQLMPMSYAGTNDLGEYRMFGLAPGKYYLSASYTNWETSNGVDRSGSQQAEATYVPTYYPGTLDVASASAIEVGPTAEVRGIDLKLHKTKAAKISGKVILPDSAQSSPVMIMLEPRGANGFMMMGMQKTAQAREKGVFELKGVTPGSYGVVARVMGESKPLVGRQIVEVGGTNVENVQIRFNELMEVPGSLKFEEPGDPLKGTIRVSLSPSEAPYSFVPMSPGVVKDDLTFTLSNILADKYLMNIVGLPDNCYVKSVKLGDQDAEDHKIDLSQGAGNIEVVISRSGAKLDGTVTNEKESKPASGVTVALVPEEGKRTRDFLFRYASTDQNGQFHMTAIPPGEYKIFAWEDTDGGSAQDPEFLKPYENKGESVSIKAGASSNIQIKMIPAGSGS